MIHILIVLGFCASSLAAAPVDGDRVRDAVVQAGRKAGKTVSPQVSARRGYPPCDASLVVAPVRKSWNVVDVSCPDPKGWRRVIRTDAAPASGPVRHAAPTEIPLRLGLVLSTSLRRGTILTAQHLMQVRIGAIGQTDLVVDPEFAIGRRLKTNIGANQPLLARHLDHEWQVWKDTPVTITNQIGPIIIDAEGLALENGQLGQKIKVQNTNSQNIVFVTVTGPNKVTVRPNIK